MRVLEKQPVRNESEYASKRREMAQLKKHYDKLAGVEANTGTDDLRSKGALRRAIFHDRPKHETRETLNQLAEELKKP